MTEIRPLMAVSYTHLTTGVESAELVRAMTDRLRPDAVIVVDALACAEPERLGCTVQLTDTGITPGSGVGNEMCIRDRL